MTHIPVHFSTRGLSYCLKVVLASSEKLDRKIYTPQQDAYAPDQFADHAPGVIYAYWSDIQDWERRETCMVTISGMHIAHHMRSPNSVYYRRGFDETTQRRFKAIDLLCQGQLHEAVNTYYNGWGCSFDELTHKAVRQAGRRSHYGTWGEFDRLACNLRAVARHLSRYAI